MSIELSETGDVFIMTIGLGPNVWNPTLLDKLEEALDKVEKSNGPKALVITAKDKFFSNGLDLKYLSKAESNQIVELFGRISKVLARVLTFPMITVCAINGHAFGAGTTLTTLNNEIGAFLALACDYRLMKQDRGFFCFPEVDLGLPLVRYAYNN
jgi:enoyl-CoA hydratase/carnithine racemase